MGPSHYYISACGVIDEKLFGTCFFRNLEFRQWQLKSIAHNTVLSFLRFVVNLRFCYCVLVEGAWWLIVLPDTISES